MGHDVRSFMVVGDSVEMMEWQSGLGGTAWFQHFRNGRLQSKYENGEGLKLGR